VKSGKMMVVIVGMVAWFSVTVDAQPRGGPMGPGRPGPVMGPRHVFAHPPDRARHIIIDGTPYWVDAGIYYQMGDDGYVIVSAPTVRVLPERTHVVVINGRVYYVVDDVYYRTAPGGYVIVDTPVESTPVVTAKPEPQTGTYTLYVPKKAGDGYVPVTLKRVDGGYIGPQGEFYPTMPPVPLLTEMYGLDEQARLERTDVFLIYVPNKDGKTFTRVTLMRRDQGFVGPQGEFYPLMPTVAHLAALYGTTPEQSTVPAQPAAQEQPAKTDETIMKVQVPRKNGEGNVEVQLKKTDMGYIGPRGELYPQMPTLDQLTPIYGE
jgi:hypothetical protein